MIRRYINRLLAAIDDRTVREKAGIHGRIDVAVHDVADLIEAAGGELAWAVLSKQERMELARHVEPVATDHVENATLQEWHEHIVDVFDPDQSPTVEEVSHFAVGTDSTGATSGDTGLTSEVFRGTLASTADQGRDLLGSAFLDTTEANGNTLSEFSLCSNGTAGSGIEHNRAVISDVVKTADKTVTIDATLEIRDA